MLDFRKKKKMNTSLYSKGVLFIFIIIIIFLANATWNVYQNYKEAKINEYRVSSRLGEVEKRESEIIEKIDKLSTERGMEEELRKRFDVAKEGENIIIVVEPDGVESGESGNINVGNTGFWDKFMNIFR